MVRTAILLLMIVWSCAAPAEAADPGRDSYLIRVLFCEGPDAKMEVYLPQSLVFGKVSLAQALARPVIGYYILDLSGAGKGKPLEPVKVSMTADGAAVTVDQYTRSLPLTNIPVKGGTVDFDRRFGAVAKCGSFNE